MKKNPRVCNIGKIAGEYRFDLEDADFSTSLRGFFSTMGVTIDFDEDDRRQNLKVTGLEKSIFEHNVKIGRVSHDEKGRKLNVDSVIISIVIEQNDGVTIPFKSRFIRQETRLEEIMPGNIRQGLLRISFERMIH